MNWHQTGIKPLPKLVFMKCYLAYIHRQALICHSENTYNYLGPLLLTLINLIPVWISNYTHYQLWDKITYPFPNFSGAADEVWEWISNFNPHFDRQLFAILCIFIKYIISQNQYLNHTLMSIFITNIGHTLEILAATCLRYPRPWSPI